MAWFLTLINVFTAKGHFYEFEFEKKIDQKNFSNGPWVGPYTTNRCAKFSVFESLITIKIELQNIIQL